MDLTLAPTYETTASGQVALRMDLLLDGRKSSEVSSGHLEFATQATAETAFGEIERCLASSGAFPDFSKMAPNAAEAAVLRQGLDGVVEQQPVPTIAEAGTLSAYRDRRNAHHAIADLAARGYLAAVSPTSYRTTETGRAYAALRLG